MDLQYEERRNEIKHIQDALDHNWVDFFRFYECNSSEELRRDVYAFLWSFHQSNDSEKRIIAVQILTEALIKDNSYIGGQVVKWLLDFKSADFNESSRKMLKMLNLETQGSYNIIKLLGIADVFERKDEIIRIASNFWDRHKNSGWESSNQWASMLVLARWNDQSALATVMSCIVQHPDQIIRVTNLLADFVFIKNQKGYDYLRDVINSDERLPPLKETDSGIPAAYYGAIACSRGLEGFPFPESKIQIKNIPEIREWLNVQKIWKIKN